MGFCSNCGSKIKDSENFCPSCGAPSDLKGPAKSLHDSDESSQYQAPPPSTSRQPPRNQYTRPPPNLNYSRSRQIAINAPYDYKLAPWGERIGAYFIDGCIANIGMVFCYLPGIAYTCFKDGIREGRSFGKGALNIRVVNFNTGMPATLSESCIRNLCDCCPCYAFVEQNRRHIGDLIAGTIVITDE